MTTMHEKYGDGSDHEICEVCGLCIPCGDCECEKTIVETCPLCGCYKTRDRVWHAPEWQKGEFVH